MNKELWKKSVTFHGHECPGLAIGVRACQAAIEKLGITFSEDEEIVCVTENDACGLDAVQVILGCTFGKGNLLYKDTGKMAFNFFNRTNGESLRMILKPFNKEMNRRQKQAYILHSAVDEIFNFSKPTLVLPEKAKLFASAICEKCGEGVAEHKMRLQNGQKVCLDCFEDYSRGW